MMNKKKTIKPFIHLHNHSRMSTSDGLCGFDDIVDRVVEIQQPAFAMTDHYYMFDLPSFYFECKAKGIKPILGCELGIYPEGESSELSKYSIEDETTNKKDIKVSYFHGLFLAKDYQGYLNLMRLASIGTKEDRFYRKPRVKRSDIKKYHKGLIFSTACLASEIDKLILADNLHYAKKVMAWYKHIFGDDFYLEIQDHGLKEQTKVNKQLIEWARKYDINLLLTNDTHYTRRELADSHRLLLCANWNQKFNDKNCDVKNKYFPTDEFYIKTSEEMYEIAKKWDCIDAYENTYKIMEKCNVDIPKETHYPKAKLKLAKDKNPNTELKLLIEQRKWHKYSKTNDGNILTSTGEVIDSVVFNKRLDKELSDIELGQVADYFLNVCYGITDYCSKNDILIGAGRGSAAGSIVSYILNITDVEPITLNLTWERFWNAGRMKFDKDGKILEISLPDIDIDIPSDRRAEVMEHCKEYFGRDNVSSIITFGTWSGKNLIQAVGKSLDIDEQTIQDVCSYISFGLSEALEYSNLSDYLEDNAEANYLVDMCKPLEGCVKNASTHAAGLLIADSALTNYTPFMYGKNGITSQYPFETLEKIGCLKVDLLGHEAEVVIDRACQYIKENHDIDIVPREIPINDKNTFKMLQRCDVRGVPQIEKDWVLDIIRDVHPEVLEHIIALVTMIRPGSLDSGQTEKYRNIRLGKLEPTPDIPQVENITKETYGTWLYQEQVMDVTKYCAGFTLSQADDLRKVVAKKKYKDKAEQLMELFKDGSINGKGKSEALTYEQWELMDTVIRNFFGYAFNKAHAGGYGVTSYRCAYLKANYFLEYMTALLNSKDNKSLPFYLDNIYEHGYNICSPDINVSGFYWTCKDGMLRPSLSIIRGCGDSVVNEIIEERELHGEYKSFEDFLLRTSSRIVKSNVIENLICVGAFDSMGYTIKTLWENVHDDGYVQYVRNSKDKALFTDKKNLLPSGGSEVSIDERKEDEEYLLGFVISLNKSEIEKRNRAIIRKVKKYREYVFVNSKLNNTTSSGRKLSMKSRKEITKKMSNKIDYDIEECTELYIRVESSNNRFISKLTLLMCREMEKQYHLNIIVVANDGNEYKIDTKSYVDENFIKKVKRFLGKDEVWI